MNIGINKKTILSTVFFIYMEHDWIKATFNPAVVAKVRDATNLTRHFQGGGSPSSQGGDTQV